MYSEEHLLLAFLHMAAFCEKGERKPFVSANTVFFC